MATRLDNSHRVKEEILSSLKRTEIIDDDIPRECRRLNRCLRYAQKGLEREILTSDKAYNDCVKRRDPEGLCTN